MQALKADIDVAALEQDVAAALKLQELAARLVQKEAALSRCMHTLPLSSPLPSSPQVQTAPWAHHPHSGRPL